MSRPFHCTHCGKPLPHPAELAGSEVRCSSCGRVVVLGGEADTVIMPVIRPGAGGRPPSSGDDTLSRSMLPVRNTNAPAVPQNEMLCRLEPGTLRWLYISEAVEAFLGKTIDQLRTKSFLDALYPDDRALAADEFRQAGELGERHDFVLRLIDKVGRLRFVRVYTQARYSLDGRINHIRGYLKDVTERVQNEQELRRRTEQLTAANERYRQTIEKLKETQGQLVHAEKLASLGTLAAGMAHEINNPLAFAMNNVTVLDREIAGLLTLLKVFETGRAELNAARPDLAPRIDRLYNEIDPPYLEQNLPRVTQATLKGLGRVAKIVENLRGFAQIDRASIGVINVNEAIEHSLNMLADALAAKRIIVNRRLEELPPLECAPADLNQVFLNLLVNAMEAIEATGQVEGAIEVVTRRAGDEVVIEVTDDGAGILPEVASKIFDPFFTTKPIGRGTGLGLSISHGIISRHAGRIAVESVPGEGSTFRINLPIRLDPLAHAPSTPPRPVPFPPAP